MNATDSTPTTSVNGEPCELVGFPGSAPIALVRFEDGRTELVHIGKVDGATHPECEVCQERPRQGRGHVGGAWFASCESCAGAFEVWEPTVPSDTHEDMATADPRIVRLAQHAPAQKRDEVIRTLTSLTSLMAAAS